MILINQLEEGERKQIEWARHQAAEEVIANRLQVKAGLEKLLQDAIISAEEESLASEVK